MAFVAAEDLSQRTTQTARSHARGLGRRGQGDLGQGRNEEQALTILRRTPVPSINEMHLNLHDPQKISSDRSVHLTDQTRSVSDMTDICWN